jgi:hypothetical protein
MIFREPLLHFLLLGAVIFVAYEMMARNEGPDRAEIVVSAGQINNLSLVFERTWQRPPTTRELDGLIREHVREEALYREGMAMGLDRNDTVIRRRLRQKLEFLADDITERTEPADADLQSYLDEHSEDFRIEPRFTFRQIYLNPARHGDQLKAEAARLLKVLQSAPAGYDTSTLGDRILLEHQYVDSAFSEVGRSFGKDFARQIEGLPVNKWHGPVSSGFGIHLVRIDALIASRVPALEEIRERVEREWSNARRLESREMFYQGLLSQYEVSIEGAAPADAPDAEVTRTP